MPFSPLGEINSKFLSTSTCVVHVEIPGCPVSVIMLSFMVVLCGQDAGKGLYGR